MNQPVAPALAALTLSLTAIPAFAGTIDPALQVQLEARPYDLHNVLVSMVDQVDLAALESRFNAERAPLAVRHQETIESLQGLASFSQASLLQDLSVMTADSPLRMRQVATVESYWLRNLVRVEATSDVIFEIAARSDVLDVHLNAPSNWSNHLKVSRTADPWAWAASNLVWPKSKLLQLGPWDTTDRAWLPSWIPVPMATTSHWLPAGEVWTRLRRESPMGF